MPFTLTLVGSLIAELLSVPLSTQLMEVSPWIPLLSGLSLVIAGCVCIIVIPETLKTAEESATWPGDGGVEESRVRFVAFKTHLKRVAEEFKSGLALLSSFTTIALLGHIPDPWLGG